MPVYSELETLDGYLQTYGKYLGKKAMEGLRPLFVPEEDAGHDMSHYLRTPYPAQANSINAIVKVWSVKELALVCGEMGTGKTMVGMLGIDAHARAYGLMVERNVSNSCNIDKDVPCYRVLVMCPNHLIQKWKREIEKTVPYAKVVTFERTKKSGADDSYKGVLKYINSCKSKHEPFKIHKDGRRGRALWSIPQGPEFVLVGRNQSKHDGGWAPVGGPAFGKAGILKSVCVGKDPILDSYGRPRFDDKGNRLSRNVIGEIVSCPKCGQPHMDGDVVVGRGDLWKDKAGQHRCGTRYLKEIVVDGRTGQGLDKIVPAPDCYSKDPEYAKVEQNGRMYEIRTCNEPLWQYTPTPRKYPPATIIQRKAKGLFDYFVLDEMHEEKSETSAQANAAAKMMTSAKRLMGLTGTLIGGYADHLFPLLMRMAPASLVKAGFTWGDRMKFAKVYGRIETTYTTKFDKQGRTIRRRNTNSMRKDDDGATKDEQVKPGVMPSFYGHHLIGNTIFLGLAEMDADLPLLIDDDRSLKPARMDSELDEAYIEVRNALQEKVEELLQCGSRKLLGTFLQTLLSYPDHPYGWETLGYTGESGTFMPVVTPKDLGTEAIRAKEAELIDNCVKEFNEGRQSWVYCMMTNKRDVQGRLAQLLKDRGLKVKILRSGTVDTTEREAWIMKNGPHVDVIISHPELVSTGLDFFDLPTTYNFSTIHFYQGDYQVNRVRQAGRRHWRIGQPEECRTYYYYYEQTMQHRQVKLVGDKYAAAKQLEGKFSAEGLAALADDSSSQMSMARSLDEKIEDIRGNWAKLRDETKVKVIQVARRGVFRMLADEVVSETEIAPFAADIASMILDNEDADLDAFVASQAKKAKPAPKKAPAKVKPTLRLVEPPASLADLDLDDDDFDLDDLDLSALARIGLNLED
jgi:superfamily II DNA or RNA helicase